MVTKCEYLNTVRFSDLEKWSAENATVSKIQSPFQLVPLKKVLHRSKDVIIVEDAVLYKRITVRLYGMGVNLRDEVFGKSIGVKRQFKAKAGQLIISRIDARNGAFGIVPADLDGAIVTNDFLLFDVEESLSQYIVLVLSSEVFQQFWQSQSSGTTNRQRVEEIAFLNSKLPFPSIMIQQRIIDEYNSTISKALNNDERIAELESSMNAYFREVLNIPQRSSVDIKVNLIRTVHLKQLNRWDAWMQNDVYHSVIYENTTLGSITVGKPLYGANEKAVKQKTDVRYIRITDINEDGSLGNECVSAQKIDPKYILKENDFLIARSGNTVGKTFLYTKDIGKAIFAGYLVKYSLNLEKIIPRYLLYYTKTDLFKAWIASNQKIFGQPNINGQEFLNAQIVVPPLAIQSRIVDDLNIIRNQITDLKRGADTLRHKARVNFEMSVFGRSQGANNAY